MGKLPASRHGTENESAIVTGYDGVHWPFAACQLRGCEPVKADKRCRVMWTLRPRVGHDLFPAQRCNAMLHGIGCAQRAGMQMDYPRIPDDRCHSRLTAGSRSEEHTSELQSLMRNSSAVFCLKK